MYVFIKKLNIIKNRRNAFQPKSFLFMSNFILTYLKMRSRIAIVVVLFLIQSACSRKSITQLEKKGVVVAKDKTTLAVGDNNKSLHIQYLGSGGMLMVDEERNIMIDPFFSHQNLWKLSFATLLGCKIKSKKSMIACGKKRILNSNILEEQQLSNNTKALFSAHGHYDHLMDFPFLFDNWFETKPMVYTNASALKSIEKSIDANQIRSLDSISSTSTCRGKPVIIPGPDGSTIRVYPIFAAHNPHFANVKFFSGSVQEVQKKLKRPKYKSKVNNWLEGRTLSFLIDIEKESTIQLRMFIQSSSCDFPDGMPPQDLLLQKSVDIAFLGVASYHFSKTSYPSTFLDSLRPKKIVFIHWEDFFRSYKRKPKTVLQTDVVSFFRTLPEKYKDKYFLPVPGAVFNVKY
jgi:hypothetical protein